MTIETSKSILKVTGIIAIVTGVIGIFIGLLTMAGGGYLAASGNTENVEMLVGGAAIFIIGIMAILGSILNIIKGSFSVRAAKDFSKIMPAWVFSIISLVFSVIQAIPILLSGRLSSATGIVISLGLSVMIFVAANTIKESVGK